jgi:hypothetical protein
MLGKAFDGGSQNLYRLIPITGCQQARQIARRPEMIEAGPLSAGGFDRFDKRALRLCSTTFCQQESPLEPLQIGQDQQIAVFPRGAHAGAESLVRQFSVIAGESGIGKEG